MQSIEHMRDEFLHQLPKSIDIHNSPTTGVKSVVNVVGNKAA